jgi:hypothetical protein
MTQDLSSPLRIVRAIHAGIAGVLFVLLPIALAGDEALRDAIVRGSRDKLRVLVYWVILGLIFLAVVLSVRRANLALLSIFALVDLPMIKCLWDRIKGELLAPVLAVSVICSLIEMSRMLAVRRRQVA